MCDLVAPFRRHLFRYGRITVGEHGYDLAAQASFIKLESGFALSAENKMRGQLHAALLITFPHRHSAPARDWKRLRSGSLDSVLSRISGAATRKAAPGIPGSSPVGRRRSIDLAYPAPGSA